MLKVERKGCWLTEGNTWKQERGGVDEETEVLWDFLCRDQNCGKCRFGSTSVSGSLMMGDRRREIT